MERITPLEYREHIEALARDIRAEARHGADLHDTLWETIDGHQWVIYYSCAMQMPALASSEASGAASDFLADCGGGLDAKLNAGGLTNVYSLIAFALLRAEVEIALERMADEEEEDEDEDEDG